MKKFLSIALIFTLVFSTCAFVPSTSSQAATKQILIARLNGNTLTCHKVSPKCKFYSLSADSVTLSKVSRSTFKKKLYDYSKQRENGVTYYWGTAAKITIKGGKVVKIQQVFQS